MLLRFNTIKLIGQRYAKIVPVTGVIGLLFLLTGCGSLNLVQDVLPRNLPSAEPQFVVHSYISPQDTVLAVSVSLSRPSKGGLPSKSQFDAVSNSVVTLSDGNRSIKLNYVPTQTIYQADPKQFPIVAGRTYQLTVSTPQGEQLTATTTIPNRVPISQVELDSVASTYNNGVDYLVRFGWQDPAQAANYYHIAGDVDYGTISRQYTAANTYTDVPYRATTPIYFTADGSINSPYLNDVKSNGREMTSSRGRVNFNYYVNGKPVANPPIDANVYLLNVTEAYYKYHQSVQQQSANRDNPFAEPTLIQGNIQGGFGCFGSYNRATMTLRVK